MARQRKAAPKPKQKRKKHQSTDYEKQRSQYRKASPRHVVEFEAVMTEDQKRYAFALADRLRQFSNEAKGIMKRRLDQMTRTKQYRKLQSDYAYCKTRMGRLSAESGEYAEWDERRKSIGKQMAQMQEQFHITEADVRSEMVRISENSGVNSVFCLREAESVWQAVGKILFGGADTLHFKKRGDLPCIRAKQPDRGILIHYRNGKFTFWVKGIGSFGILDPGKDLFLQEELSSIARFLGNSSNIESRAVETFTKTGIIIDTFRPVYASLRCETIRGKLRVYVQITAEAKACPKRKKDGTPRHNFNKTGKVGVDMGTQSVTAVAGDGKDLILENLAERGHHCTKEGAAKERRLLRKIDRSRRATNPDNYNADGTVKPRQQRKPWKKSRRCLELQKHYREACRKNADSRKYANRELANRIREMGDELYIEPKNAAKLQRKAKESKVTVREDGSMKHSRRKRFGKSILHRCSGACQADLKLKFGDGYHEVPAKYRASQYDHTTGRNIKKGLDDRVYPLSDGTIVQRDCYSAFLLAHPNEDVTTPDQEACTRDFPAFQKQMDARMREIKASGYEVCNSGSKIYKISTAAGTVSSPAA